MSDRKVYYVKPLPSFFASPLNIPLDTVSKVMGSMTVSGALLFNGTASVEKLQSSILQLATCCPYMFGQMKTEDSNGALSKNVYVVPRQPECHITLDYLDLSTTPFTPEHEKDVTKLLPFTVHEKMSNGFLAYQNMDELPISAFSLTQFQGSFTIGYRLNHAFCDQCGVVSVMRCLSLAYESPSSNGLVEAVGGKVPYFLPRDHLVPAETQFKGVDDFKAGAPKGYNAEAIDFSRFSPAPPVAEFYLKVRPETIQALRASDPSLSSNDFIHAVLLKALSRLEGLDAEEPLRIMYARNMRKPCGVDEFTAHGDYVRVQECPVPIQNAQAMSVTELAQLNRSLLNNPEQVPRFHREVLWYRSLKKFSATGLPNCVFFFHAGTCIVTNWASFPYDEIKFGGHTPLTLLMETPPVLVGKSAFVRIGFDSRGGGERRVIVNVATKSQSFADAVKTVATESGVFEIA